MAAYLPPPVFVLLLLSVTAVFGLPEQGVWDVEIHKGQLAPFTKSMYNDSMVSVKITCFADKDPTNLTITWLLRWTPCAEEYVRIEEDEILRNNYMLVPEADQYRLNYPYTTYQKSAVQNVVCDGNPVTLQDESSLGYDRRKMMKVPEQPANKNVTNAPPVTPAATQAPLIANSVTQSNRARREVSGAKSTTPTGKFNVRNETRNDTRKMGPEKHIENDLHVIARTWEDGIYLFLIDFASKKNQLFKAEVNVRMKGPTGYLSAIEWPLLPFYGTMCVFYVLMALVWMVLSACNWRDLLRIQFWIGGVILLGMLEKAVFFGEYSSINFTGKSVRGGMIFAELVSCLKRTLARMLVVIVSLGFGIVKPRLGPMLHRVLGMGALYFILSSVEGCLRILRRKSDISSHALLANIPLAVLDAAICWWSLDLLPGIKYRSTKNIFLEGAVQEPVASTTAPSAGPLMASTGPPAAPTAARPAPAAIRLPTPEVDGSDDEVFTSLVQTTRTLRLRRNLVKLSLYRHFTNTLIFAVLASVAFMIWSIKQHKLTTCLRDWKEIWVDDAFWHLLFSIILLVIMILWRPNNNNQRYAFSPLLDAADDEAEEPMMNDAYEGMKMRGNSTSRSTSPKPKEAKNKPEDDKSLTEDDLKWIEENIPASVTDAAIPSLLDSDEEIMTTKFEMSKME